jgi:hypothetical protein
MIRLSLLGIGVVLTALPAAADIKTACKADVQANCSSIKPGKGKLMECIAENRAKLSNDCKLAIADTMLERRAKKAKHEDD